MQPTHESHAQDKNDTVFLRVAGDLVSTPPPEEARVVSLEPGEDYARVSEALESKGWSDAYLLTVLQ